MSRIYIGIDPGTQGAAAAVREDGSLWYVTSVPYEDGAYDERNMLDILRYLSTPSHHVHVYLEKSGAYSAGDKKVGVTSAFSMGLCFGLWKMALVAARLPHDIVTAQTWQKQVGITKGLGDTPKARAKARAEQLWPGQDWGKNQKLAEGKRDAALMAEAARRTVGAARGSLGAPGLDM